MLHPDVATAIEVDEIDAVLGGIDESISVPAWKPPPGSWQAWTRLRS